MFGKIMSISDDLMWRYIDVLSFKSIPEIQQLKQSVADGMNPRDIKIDFAKEIVTRFHDNSQAEEQHKNFIARFQKGMIPDDLEEQLFSSTQPVSLIHLLKQINLTASTSESIRMIKQGAVKIDGEKVVDTTLQLAPDGTYIVQVGKRRIAKLRIA